MSVRLHILIILCVSACASGPRANSGAEPDAPFTGNQAVSTRELLSDVEACQQAGGKTDICIVGAYYDRGYINVKLGAPAGDSSAQKFHIQEGPRFRIGKTSFTDSGSAEENDEVGDPAALRALMPFTSGDWFNRSQMNEYIDGLKKRYQDAGYASVHINPLTKVEMERHRVDIEFSITRGSAGL